MTHPSFKSIGVIGAGAWGTALAITACRAGRAVRLWGRNQDDLTQIEATQQNPRYLPDITLTPCPPVVRDLSAILECDALLLVVPAQQISTVVADIAAQGGTQKPVIICAKGIERGTGQLMSAVVRRALPHAPLATLSGPTFAREVALNLPAAVTIAAENAPLAEALCMALNTTTFRCYASDDLLGVELGGAVKNVLAIACGIAAGRQLGDNARAALLTRGLAELARLGRHMGAQPSTIMGLSGLGDLVLTATSTQSRNYSFGLALGQGDAESLSKLTEGRFTASAVMELARQRGVDLPICAAVDAVINHNASIEATLNALLQRPLKMEIA